MKISQDSTLTFQFVVAVDSYYVTWMAIQLFSYPKMATLATLKEMSTISGVSILRFELRQGEFFLVIGLEARELADVSVVVADGQDVATAPAVARGRLGGGVGEVDLRQARVDGGRDDGRRRRDHQRRRVRRDERVTAAADAADAPAEAVAEGGQIEARKELLLRPDPALNVGRLFDVQLGRYGVVQLSPSGRSFLFVL